MATRENAEPRPVAAAIEARRPSELSGFQFERAAFEIKFALALHLWDRAGALWNEATQKWAGLKLVAGDPARTLFKLDQEYNLGVELEAARVTAYSPDLSLGHFSEVSDHFVRIVTRTLEIPLLSRVGLRLFFFQEFPDRQSATQAFMATQLAHVPEGRHFGSEGPPASLEYCIRWEVKSLGIRVWVGYQYREYRLEPPSDLRVMQPKDYKYHGLLFDIDFYTTSQIEVGQLGVKDWIHQNMHALRRDIDSFLWK